MESISNEKFYDELKFLNRFIDKKKNIRKYISRITVMISLPIDGFVFRPPFEQKFRRKHREKAFSFQLMYVSPFTIFRGSVKWYINSKAWNKADQIRKFEAMLCITTEYIGTPIHIQSGRWRKEREKNDAFARKQDKQFSNKLSIASKSTSKHENRLPLFEQKR